MTVISIDSFMNLQHDEVVKKLDIAAVAIVSVITLFELIISQGIYCKAPYATFLLATRVGTTSDLQEPFKTSGTGIPWNPSLVTVAVIVYLVSVLVENRENIKKYSLDTVLQILPKLPKRTSQIEQDPEQGEELQSASSTVEARRAVTFVLDRPLSFPTNSGRSQEVARLSEIIQVAAYKPSTSPEEPSVCGEDTSETRTSSSRHEAMACSKDRPAPSETQDSTSVAPFCQEDIRVQQEVVTRPEKLFPRCETLACHEERPGNTENLVSVLHPTTEGHSNTTPTPEGESAQETSWKASFLIVFFSFMIGFIFILADMKNGLAIGVFERLLILAYYCLPFYWVLLVEECYLVSKRIFRSSLADYFSIYFD